MTYPLSTAPGQRALDLGGDTRLFLWTIAWDLHALREQPARLFDANIFYPQHNTLAYSENLVGVALLAAPVYAFTGQPLLALNSATLALLALGGLGAYFLARALGQSWAAALLGGVVFAFAPPRLMRLGQPHMLALAWMPFCLAALQRYLATRRRLPLQVALWCFCLQTLSSGHGALTLALGALGLALHFHLTAERISLRRLASDVGWAACAPALLTALMTLPYLRAHSEMGLTRTLDEARFWSPNAASFVAPATHLDRAILGLLPSLSRAAEREARTILFPGWFALGLALLALRRPQDATQAPAEAARLDRRLLLVELALAAAVSLALAAQSSSGLHWRAFGLTLTVRSAARPWLVAGLLLGLRLAFAPRRRSLLLQGLQRACRTLQAWLALRLGRAQSFYVWLGLLAFWAALGPDFGLYALLHRVLPGFDLIRVPSRLFTLVVLSLAVLAGTGLDRWTRGLGRRRASATAAAALLLVTVEYVAAPLPAAAYSVELPAIDRWLAGQPRPFSLVELPVADPREEGRAARWQTLAMLDSLGHWQGLVNGYSGFTPPEHDRLFRLLASFPNEAALTQLESWDVCYVIVHPERYPAGAWALTQAQLARFPARLTLLQTLDGGRAYRLTRAPCAGRGPRPGVP